MACGEATDVEMGFDDGERELNGLRDVPQSVLEIEQLLDFVKSLMYNLKSS